ncbi:MAG: hypothetical protein ACT4PM_09740 [Gemmatimonadales bacterium]
MPVTARLLQRLHETLGDAATGDLFVWWEEAATVNRTAVRDVADLYFERLDAQMDKRLGAYDARMEKRLGALEAHLGALEAHLETRLAEFRAEWKGDVAKLEKEMATQQASLITWMFIFWMSTILPLAGLMVALVRSL